MPGRRPSREGGGTGEASKQGLEAPCRLAWLPDAHGPDRELPAGPGFCQKVLLMCSAGGDDVEFGGHRIDPFGVAIGSFRSIS
jgi:hypothetical protein